LFSRDSCEFLSISQFLFLILIPNCLLSAFICVNVLVFLSRRSPKYSTSRFIGTGKLLMLTCGQSALLAVYFICVDFAGLTVIFHCSIQVCSRLRFCCNFCEAVVGSWSHDIIAVSSAKVAISAFSVSGISVLNVMYRRRPKMVPWKTPARIRW
jgi:hypothetical protein